MFAQAATFAPHSIERMLHVAAFAVSGYSGTNNRTLKPFNPLLGETFEFQYPEQGWRGIAEKVRTASHHIREQGCTDAWPHITSENEGAQMHTCLAMRCCMRMLPAVTAVRALVVQVTDVSKQQIKGR